MTLCNFIKQLHLKFKLTSTFSLACSSLRQSTFKKAEPHTEITFFNIMTHNSVPLLADVYSERRYASFS
jgi:hypothetical protein